MPHVLVILMLLSLALRADIPDPAKLASEGDFAGAAEIYLEQADASAARGDRASAILELMNAASCMKMSGDISAATYHTDTIGRWLGEHAAPAARLEWLALRGSVLALGKRPANALPPLQEGLQLELEYPDPSLRIDLLNDLGIALSATGRHREAAGRFSEIAALAVAGDRPGILIRARQNHLVAAFQAWSETRGLLRRIEEVGSWTGETEAVLAEDRKRLDDSLARALAVFPTEPDGDLLSLGLRLTAAMAADRSGQIEVANKLFGEALEAARTTGNPGFEASALLGLAEQYGDAGRFEESLALLNAVRAPGGHLAPPEVARLEILTAEARHAIAPTEAKTGEAIRRAVAAVETIRSDLSRSQFTSDLGRGFREFAGRPYILLADHLLQASDRGDPTTLRAARDAIESFKTWELNDFYRDDCVNLALEQSRDLDRLEDPSVAVIYILALDERTEILVGHRSGLRRFTSPVPAEELLATARRFRYRLESDYGTYRFLDDAELLHRQILGPALPHLRSLGVRHLVFVPDGALGNIPFGALSDPATERYVIRDFSTSIAPNLSLLGGAPSDDRPVTLLAGGLSEASQGFPAIPAVAAELAGVEELYSVSTLLDDRAFTTDGVRRHVTDLPVSVVHLATHGEFLGRTEGSFLLTHDGRITLDQLEEMIRPKKFVGEPVNLLCLSACRTAAGDDRAALGLAGAAVKSGARSVVATLWYVEDESTARVMTEFHKNLLSQPNGGKAAALRDAQLGLLTQDPDAHPALWAPFVLIGDWQ